MWYKETMNNLSTLDLKDIGLTFDAEEHIYSLAGTWVPGVTTITDMLPKPWLGPWMKSEMGKYIKSQWTPGFPFTESGIDQIIKDAKQADKKKSKDAMGRGKDVHAAIEQYIGGSRPEEMPEGSPEAHAWDEFKKWEAEARPVWLATELRVGSPIHGYAGTLDAIATIQNRRMIVDFKTNATPSESWNIQTAAYQMALHEMGVEVQGRVVVRIPKEKDGGSYSITTAIEDDFKAFLALKEVYGYCQRMKRAASPTGRGKGER